MIQGGQSFSPDFTLAFYLVYCTEKQSQPGAKQNSVARFYQSQENGVHRPWYPYASIHLTPLLLDPPCQQITEGLFHDYKLILDSSLIETEQSATQSFSTSRGGLEEDKDHPMTATPTSSSKDWKAQVASAIDKQVNALWVLLQCLWWRCLSWLLCSCPWSEAVAGDGSWSFLLCRSLRSHCILNAN